MRRFWGFYKNESYCVGCNGATVYIYDKDENEIARFKNIPYAYTAAFMPGRNIISVKSTEGFLAFYDLDSLSLLKKITVTRDGAQDEGFAFTPDGKFFYNIEKPFSSTRTQLGIYETKTFTKVATLFAEDKNMVLDCLAAAAAGKTTPPLPAGWAPAGPDSQIRPAGPPRTPAAPAGGTMSSPSRVHPFPFRTFYAASISKFYDGAMNRI